MSEQDQDPAVTPEHVEVLEETEVVTGAVKWFNRVKGFGFITPPDGSGDIFLHLSALKTAGYESVDEGTTLVCEVARGPKGMQAVRVLEVDASTAAPSEGRPLRPGRRFGARHRAGRAVYGCRRKMVQRR